MNRQVQEFKILVRLISNKPKKKTEHRNQPGQVVILRLIWWVINESFRTFSESD